MLELDARTAQAMSPAMERVLVIDPAPASARMLADLLHNIWPGQVMTAGSVAAGLQLAPTLDPRLIFVEHADDLDGLEFSRRLRRSDFPCRKAPVVMATARATPAVILGARDAGVHEFLRKPFTNKDLVRRIEAVALHPRGWVEGVAYVGPDRRRFNSAEYQGPRKRRVDTAGSPDDARLVQALRIVAAAAAAVEADPRQALRSLTAQADEFRLLAVSTKNPALAVAAAELKALLVQADETPLTCAALTPVVERLSGFMPEGFPAKERPAA